MKIIIAGYGFVGKAVANALQLQHEIIVQDPKYTDYKMIDHYDADGIIICVGTPELPSGGCDCKDIASVLDDVPVFMPVLIKSSVTPEVINALAEIYPDHCITYSPEFLRANTANADFINQKYMILGGEDPDCFWQDLFTTVLKNCKIYFNCTALESAMVKYSINAFLATKVSFFNNIYDLCEKMEPIMMLLDNLLHKILGLVTAIHWYQVQMESVDLAATAFQKILRPLFIMPKALELGLT